VRHYDETPFHTQFLQSVFILSAKQDFASSTFPKRVWERDEKAKKSYVMPAKAGIHPKK